MTCMEQNIPHASKKPSYRTIFHQYKVIRHNKVAEYIQDNKNSHYLANLLVLPQNKLNVSLIPHLQLVLRTKND